MPDQLPSTVESREVITKAVGQLARMVSAYARDRNRVRKLATFADRTQKDGKIYKNKAKVEYNDRPEIELYLAHRDDFEAINDQIEERKKSISALEGDPNVITACVQALARLEDVKWRHLTAMEKILAKISDELGSRESIMAKLAADYAKLAQADAHHRERMDLEKDSDDTLDDKIDRLAKRHKMSREDVCKLLQIPTIQAVDADTAADG